MPVFCPIAYNLAFAAETEKVAAAAGQENVLCMTCQVAAKLLLISDAFNRNDFQRMEGEVEIEMAASIARSRATFDEAYIRLRQTHPSLPVQLRDFQVSCILVCMCPEKKNIVPFFRLT